MHFVYGVENQSIPLSIDLIKYTVPLPPDGLLATVAQDSIILNWIPSPPGPGDSLYYIIYRNADSLDVSSDTSYVDSIAIEGSTNYIYKVTCVNEIGESQPSNFVTIQSWPNENNVNRNQILSIYPNPIHRTNDSHILYALGSDYLNTILELINLRGQVVKTISLQSYQQGWHRESINSLVLPKTAMGIYFIRLQSDNGFGDTQKITILP